MFFFKTGLACITKCGFHVQLNITVRTVASIPMSMFMLILALGFCPGYTGFSVLIILDGQLQGIRP
jgi:hypothetical protein